MKPLVSYEVNGLVSLTGPKGVLVSTTKTVDGTGDPRCFGQSQYRDISDGTVVTVYDDNDEIVAYGVLGPGRTGNRDAGDQPVASCVFPIVVTEVPTDKRFYRVQIGTRAPLRVENTPENGVLYVFIGLDDDPGHLPPIAGQPPRIPGGS